MKVRCDCSFCWYLWNCWPSLFKFSFLNWVGSFFFLIQNWNIRFKYCDNREACYICYISFYHNWGWGGGGGGRGRDCIVVRFTTTSAVSVYHHLRCKFESRSWRDVLDTTLCDISDLRQVGGFLRVLRFPPWHQ